MESESRRQEGLIAASEGRHADAIAAFRDVRRAQPDNAKVAMLLGNELVRAGHEAEGIRTLAAAAALDPNDARIWTNLAIARYQKGQSLLAYRDAHRALSIDPNDADAQRISDLAEGAPPDVAALAEREPFWTRLGIGLVIAGFVVTVLLARFPVVNFSSAAGKSAMEGSTLKSDPLSQYLVIALVFIGVGSSLWMLLDVLNRRARLLWLMPNAICCICGAPWGPLALYIFAGRKTRQSP
jgi:tetratricopeptide (TPR) repeat protein